MSRTPVLTTELLARGWQWYDGSLSGMTDEVAKLRAIPYFAFERWYLGEHRNFTVLGILSYRSPHGRTSRLRVRLEYPSSFDGAVPAIFDHDHIFLPTDEGHLCANWLMCLTFPPRGEFLLRAGNLSEQVLGAALLWLDKRLIFERTGRKTWPGPAEPHGIILPAVLLLLEKYNLLGNLLFITYLGWLLRSRQQPNFDGSCVCGRQLPMRDCHGRAIREIYAAIIRG